MQAADPGKADDVGFSAGPLLDGTSRRRVLVYPEMRPVHVVVGDKGLDQLPQVALVGSMSIDRIMAVSPAE